MTELEQLARKILTHLDAIDRGELATLGSDVVEAFKVLRIEVDNVVWDEELARATPEDLAKLGGGEHWGKSLVKTLETIPKEDRDAIADNAIRNYINAHREPDESYEQAQERLWEVFHAGERLKQEQEKAR